MKDLNNMNPLVSIITPTYNHEKFIAECIESVLEQTYPNWEMIIVDDCSTDNTVKIIESYMNKDKRIKLIRHKYNYGALALDKTYNEALSIAKGDWIAILEGDDVWPCYKLERQVNTINTLETDVVLLHGRIGFIYEDLKKITIQKYKTSLSKVEPCGIPYDAFDYLIYGYNPVYSVTALIKADALKKIGGFIQDPKEIRLVDFSTWLRLSMLGKFYKDTYILGFWRRHRNSITMNFKDKIAINYKIAIEKFLISEGIQLNNKCIGKFQYFGAIVQTIFNKDYGTAKLFLDELSDCINSGLLPIDKLSRFKLLIFRVVLSIRQPWILKILYNLKREKFDMVLEYKPFFFKDENFISKYNAMLSIRLK